jgi:hypothetical protein
MLNGPHPNGTTAELAARQPPGHGMPPDRLDALPPRHATERLCPSFRHNGRAPSEAIRLRRSGRSRLRVKRATAISEPAPMNMQTSDITAPPAPKSLEAMQLPLVMMRDIVLKTMFRKNVETVSDLARAICLPVPVAQELLDMARGQQLLEATGTLNANSGDEMGYKLTETGKARALDALAQSEYYAAMPVPLDIYTEQVKRQSIRNIRIPRDMLMAAMGHLVLPSDLLDQLGPAVSSGRSILMYGPPGNGKSAISDGIGNALGDRIYVPRAIEYAGQVITVYDPIVHSAAEEQVEDTHRLRRTT